MSGKTHLAFGLTSSLLVTRPDKIQDVILCLGAASIGSLISDIDVSSSKFHKYVNIALGVSAIITFIFVMLESLWNINLHLDNERMRIILGIVTFLIICFYGKEQPHRSAMHSVLALIGLTACIYLVIPNAAIYFAVGMASHIIIDVLNFTNVKLLYPLKWGISFDLCHADGKVNKILFRLFSATTVILVTVLVSNSFIQIF